MDTAKFWISWYKSLFVNWGDMIVRRKPSEWEIHAHKAYIRDKAYEEIKQTGKCMLILYLQKEPHAIDGQTWNALQDTLEKFAAELQELGEVYRPMIRKTEKPEVMILDSTLRTYERDGAYMAHQCEELRNQKKKTERPPLFGKPSAAEEEKARKEAAEILAKAKDAGDVIRQNAAKEAAHIREQARQKAQEIRQDAEKERCAIRAEARQAAETIANNAKIQAQENVKNHMSSEMKSYLTQLRTQWEAENAEQIQAEKDAAVSIRQAQDLGCAHTNGFQVEMVKLLEDTVKKMNDLKYGLCQDLRQWQESLYRAEFEPICQCYIDLFRMVKKLDTLVRKEQAAEILKKQENPDAPAVPMLDALQNQHRNMEIMCRRMEKAMRRMGLQLFTPEAGEKFDSYLHVEYNSSCSDADCDGRTITGCVVPGVEHVRSEADREVLIPAEVVLE